MGVGLLLPYGVTTMNYNDETKEETTEPVWNPAQELFIKQTVKFGLLGGLIGIAIIGLLIKI